MEPSDPLLCRVLAIAPDDPTWRPLVLATWARVGEFMSRCDASHDLDHIRRVTGLALTIHSRLEAELAATTAAAPAPPRRRCCPRVVALAALLHDVGDHKYLPPGDDASQMARDALLAAGCADRALAERVQTVCAAVGYSGEVRDPARVRALIDGDFPELAVVQDADRLDAIGAVGIGRTFAYEGARDARGRLATVIDHFADKLVRLESMMKTGPGREMARVRTERLIQFRGWWEDEVAEAQSRIDG